MNAALDAFFADPDQQGYGCIPKGLDWKWDQFAGPYLQQAEAVSREQRIADNEAEYKRVKAEYEARDWKEKQARKQKPRQRKANETHGEREAEPVAIAELVPAICAKLGRA